MSIFEYYKLTRAWNLHYVGHGPRPAERDPRPWLAGHYPPAGEGQA